MSRSLEIGCTVRIALTPEEMHALVELDGDVEIHPGDRVTVHGDLPCRPGEEVALRRRATVTRASRFERALRRLTGDLAVLELLEVGFSDRRTT